MHQGVRLGLVLGTLGALALSSCGDDGGGGGGGPSSEGGAAGAPSEGGAPVTTGGGTSGGMAPQGGEPTTGGEGGVGGSGEEGGDAGAATDPTQPIVCEQEVCDPLDLSSYRAGLISAPCCTGDTELPCGLSTEILREFEGDPQVECVARDQPGTIDASCPDSPDVSVELVPGVSIMFNFPGCCSELSGSCGYQVDQVADFPQLRIGLGCVDATSFEGAGADGPIPCGEGAGGAPGEGGGGPGGSGDSGSPGAGGSAGSG